MRYSIEKKIGMNKIAMNKALMENVFRNHIASSNAQTETVKRLHKISFSKPCNRCGEVDGHRRTCIRYGY